MKFFKSILQRVTHTARSNPRSTLCYGLLLMLCAVCIVWIAALHSPKSGFSNNFGHTPDDSGSSVYASIYSDGILVDRILLSDTGSYERTITNKAGGTNTICLSDGCIGVTHASCPNKQCIHFGMVSYSAIPIVCVPNHLVITFERKGSPDNDGNTNSETGSGFIPDGITY